MHSRNPNSSEPIIFIPNPALYRVVPQPASQPQPPSQPSPDSPLERLKKLDQLLDLSRHEIDKAKRFYEETLQDFATLCHRLWTEEKAQGSRQGKGFRSRLQSAGIKVGRAYRAMQKFFPADFPTQSKPKPAKGLTSSAANEVGLHFTGRMHQGKELLQCLFALTPEEKVEFAKCLEVVDASQVQRLLLDAMKEAAKKASVADEQKEEIANKAGPRSELATHEACPRGELASRRDAGCSGVSLADAVSTTGAAGTGGSPLSPETCDLPLGLERAALTSEIANKGLPSR